MSNNNLDYIIPPVNKALLEAELNQETFVRKTNKGNNEIHIINHHNSPNVMREIGRLREITFSSAGGGTGKEIDIDYFDTCNNCYQQLIVYNKEETEIVSGYRFIDCSILEVSKSNKVLSTQNYFNFSDKFISDYIPYTIELGRSWVQPKYQPSNNPRKGLFALDNLWDGLGAILLKHPNLKYFFGKVTMYTSYNTEARDAVLTFMEYYFPDKENLITPLHPLKITSDLSLFEKSLRKKSFKEGYKELQLFVRERNENVPPLINSYMHLSPTMKSFGTASNPDFGGVEETGILVTVNDVYPEKKDRHISY